MNKKANGLSFLSKKKKINFLLTIMRVFILFLFFGLTSVYANNSYSQTKLNINLKNATFEELFDQIHSQSEFIFFYKDDIIKTNNTITLSLKESTINEILNRAFVKTDLTYKILDRQIVISKQKKEAITKTFSDVEVPVQDAVTGKVTTADGGPLPGASVIVKGTNRGTQTDFDGNYQLEVASGETIVFSYVGFTTKEVVYSGQTPIEVVLAEDASELSEVVVTGYTRQNTRNITGSVTVVQSEAIAATTPTSLEQALQGQAAGVTVGVEGGPGGNSAVRIRGYGTINGNDPLYVIDGVQTGQGLSDLNPDDIASIQILKDAAAASIYGIGAANGVIVITTKSGKKNNKVTFSYSGLTGVDFIPESVFPEFATPQQIADAYWQALANDGQALSHPQYGSGTSPVLPDYILPAGVSGTVDESTYSFPDNRITRANKGGTDWFGAFFDPAFVQQHNISARGGGENSKLYVGLGVLDQEGVGIATSFERYNLRVNSEFNITDRFRLGESVNVSYSERIGFIDPVGSSSNQNNEGQIAALYRSNPLIPVTDIAGNFAGTATIGGVGNASNAIGAARRNANNPTETIRALGSIYAEFDIMDGLLIKSTFTADMISSEFSFFRPVDVENSAARQVNLLRETSTSQINTNWYNILQYTKTLGDVHSIDAFVGTEFKKNRFEQFFGQITNFLEDTPDFTFLSAGTGAQTVGSGQNKSSSFSVFGKVDYAYDDKYLVSATLRQDNSSLFEAGNQDAIFPAISLGWRVSGESFLEDSSIVSNLLLKLSWGELGNNSIPAFRGVTSFASNLDFYDYNGQTGFFLANIGDPGLTWETTTTTNFGISASLFNSALDIDLDVYNAVTKDMLLAVPTDPTVFGNTIGSIFKNFGEMTNTGFDLGISYSNNSTAAFSYSVGVNISHYKNEVDFLDENNLDQVIANPNLGSQTGFETTNTVAGEPISSFVGFTWEGIDPATGRAIITGDSRDIIGSPHPDFTYGITFDAEYKNFDLSLLFQGSQGNDIYNLTKFWTDFSNFEGARSLDYIQNSWTPTNTGGSLPAYTLSANEAVGSSYYIEDGSYVRLKNISVGYTLGENISSKLKADKIRIFLQGKNLLTFTSYDGLDPEINLSNYTNQQQANLEIGVDRGAYPVSRSVNLGLNVSF
ncbi:TonB-dependent receptor [Aquimarina algiphila]|uniref:TonB-dependent receptor n=1 Tax=Aquimarina algiphila TaxID=2047982 RepID=A0A554VEM7_9FLAO|nr:TonB-dependent receptor [Aquimarina algiphila]TSE05547.1 TonB-dependent receptor [Aquimarina algiphila]